MTDNEKRAADQLDAAITARQAGRAQPPLDAANSDDAALAASLVEAAHATGMDSAFAARLENDLMQRYERRSASPFEALRQWGESWMNYFTQISSRSVGWAVAATLFIALASFALIRNIQSAGPSAQVTLLPTKAPVVQNVTATATPTTAASTATPEPSATNVILVVPTATTSPTIVPAQASATPVPAQPTATRTPTTTPTRAPTATPSHTATPSRTPTSAPTAATMTVKITMLDVDGTTPGKHIGCGDTVVLVDRTIPTTTAPLSAAIREQLSIHDQYYGQSGLQNAIYRSTLTFVSASIANGHATINLTGTIRTGGVCDAPRVASQFEETALQFSTVTSVTTFVNGVEINQAMSQK